MHVEKNVCENVLGTLLNIQGKTKDTDKARLDLQDLRIRKELHLKYEDGHWVKPHAKYVLTREETRVFCNLLKSVRFPDGYAGNLAKNVIVEQGKVYGLKSHDCHVLLQRIIPIAIRPFLTKQIRDALVEFSQFFKKLTSVTLYVRELEALQEEIVRILCKLERIFPPSFFTIMVHLCVHLPQEAILGGPVQSRWMYPIERYLGHLKRYVRNKAKPEGSIAEGYVVEEAITFCSHYLRGVESKWDKRGRTDDQTSSNVQSFALDIFRVNGRGIGKKETHILPKTLMKKALWFIFNNCNEVQSYLEEHLQLLQRQDSSSSNITEIQQSTFPDWFAKRIGEMYRQNPCQVNEELYALSCLPDNRVSLHKGYIVNGVKFLIKSRDDTRQTQNCGVTVPGVHDEVEDDYYGYLYEVIELSFIKGYHIILFKCIWFDTNRRRNHVIFEPNFISIDTSRHAYNEDPFVFANQAKQVFYVNDPLKPNSCWKIIERSSHRHLWDIPDDNNAEDMLEDVDLHREDAEEEVVENVVKNFDDTIDDLIDEEIYDSDHTMEEVGSESNEDDSHSDKSNDEIENVDSDDDEF